jgi:hypothetical protein
LGSYAGTAQIPRRKKEMTTKHMIFIVIPAGKFPKTRMQLAKDSKKKLILNMSVPVFYADEDSRIVFTSPESASEYAHSKRKSARFVEAGK